jgi:hypothetical protein
MALLRNAGMTATISVSRINEIKRRSIFIINTELTIEEIAEGLFLFIEISFVAEILNPKFIKMFRYAIIAWA